MKIKTHIAGDSTLHYGTIKNLSVEDEVAIDEDPLSSHHVQHRRGIPPFSDAAESSTSNAVPRFLSRGMSDHWDSYVAAVERRPLLTKSMTAVLIFSAADAFAQLLEHTRGVSKVESFDWPRCARFAAFGLFGAPWSHYYFHWLDKWLPPSPNPWSMTTLQKVAIDQFIQAPILLAIMICALSLMKGEGLGGVKRDMSHSFFGALIANCKNEHDQNCLAGVVSDHLNSDTKPFCNRLQGSSGFQLLSSILRL